MRPFRPFALWLAVWAGLASAFPGAAIAGAWTRTRGEGLLIVTTARRASPLGGLTGGVADSEANISQLYLEYGLTDALTLGAKTYVEFSLSEPERSAASAGGFLRQRLWQDGRGGIASVQAGYDHPVDSLLGGSFSLADPGAVPEAHVAALYGRGWGGLGSSTFLSTGAAWHWRGDGADDEFRVETTAGRAWNRSWMGVLSLFGLIPLGPDTDASLKISPSVAYTIWPTGVHHARRPHRRPNPPTVQLGVSYDVLNPGDGLGVSVSIWRRF